MYWFGIEGVLEEVLWDGVLGVLCIVLEVWCEVWCKEIVGELRVLEDVLG